MPTLTLESAFGSVAPSSRPEDFEAITRRAKDDKAERSASQARVEP